VAVHGPTPNLRRRRSPTRLHSSVVEPKRSVAALITGRPTGGSSADIPPSTFSYDCVNES